MSKPRFVLASVVVVLVLLAAALVVSSVLPPHQSDEVAVPAAQASPEEVVTAYLEALDAHDCETAEALSAEESSAASWCDDVAHLDDVVVHQPLAERTTTRAGSVSGPDVASVPVSFAVSFRLFHADAGMEEGPTSWGYRLARAGQDDPWRIVDQGAG